MPEFNTQAEVDAHNATVKIQREAAGQFADNQKMSCYSKAIIHDLFPFATLTPQGNVGPSGRLYRCRDTEGNGFVYLDDWYSGRSEPKDSEKWYTILSARNLDRAVVAHTLCPVEVWWDAIVSIFSRQPCLSLAKEYAFTTSGAIKQCIPEVIAEAQRILTEREARP
jgi:hypothetical protein